MMNHFKEFDKIKTPEDWKNISFIETKKRYIQKYIIYACVVLCVSMTSIGLIYALNNEFRIWVHQQFHIETKTLKSNFHQLRYDKCFMYETDDYGEVNGDVYVLKNGQYVKEDALHYENDILSFDYVRYQDNIVTYHHSGTMSSMVLPLMKDNLLYFISTDDNLYSLNMDNDEVIQLTYDHLSVNPAISPSKKYILLNKKDQYWTVYNTESQKETRLNELSAYAHNNTYGFLDDDKLVTYNDESETIVIDLETNEVENLHVYCWDTVISTLTIDCQNEDTIITDHYHHKQRTIPLDLSKYEFYTIANRYIVCYDAKEYLLIDIETGKYKSFNASLDNEQLECRIVDNQYMVISCDKDYVVVDIWDFFDDSI